MSHTDASVVVNPGVESYNFFCKTPTGSYTTAFVHGITYSSFVTYNTANNYGKATLERKRSALALSTSVITLNSNDTIRRIGLEATYTGDVVKETSFAVTTHASQCAAIISGDYVGPDRLGRGWWYSTNCGTTMFSGAENFAGGVNSPYLWVTTSGSGTLCSGVTYAKSTSCGGLYATNYSTFADPVDLAGCFYSDTAAGESVSLGSYTYKRTFDLGSIPASASRIRIKIRIGNSPTGGVSGSFVGVKINGVNATYTNFETQTSSYIPIEISEGFVSGVNELEFTISSASTSVLPSVSFEFLPTTATIESSTGFSALTAAQKDLIGNGTPVQVTVGTTSSLYAYNGSGDKGTTAAYTFLRDV
ncbi:hypothetical protein EBX31_12130 [bacterium]|nr:hypothetical protein [bacterium]